MPPYTPPSPPVSVYGIGRASWGIDVENDLADHETRLVAVEASGAGDVVGPSSSVASEIALFDGTTGKLIKRATGTGYVKVTSGVMGTPAATVPLATDVSGNLPLANLPSTLAQILKAQVTLTDAQIKALVTTPITLVAAPGAGLRISPIAIDLVVNATAGVYTNVNATDSAIWAQLGSTAFSDYLVTYSADGLNDLGVFLTTAAIQFATLRPWRNHSPGYGGGVAPSYLSAAFLNTALSLTASNNGAGNFTGGNAANSLIVTVLYMVL